MNWRKLLLPFSALFWLITSLRNLAYSVGLLHSKKYNIPVICIGNLSVGGTGKSPHVILVADILKEERETAMLSRGYGRKTSGLGIANYSSKVYDIGDEPLQFFNRFKNKVVVAVSENRQEGIEHLMEMYNTEIVIMDDGFQHRAVKPGFSILLTTFNEPYTQDYLLPAGNLREPRSGAKRADVIIVTKCSDEFTVKQKTQLIEKIKPKKNQHVFFSKVVYSHSAIGYRFTLNSDEWIDYEVLLITGIAKSAPFVEYVNSKFKKIHHWEYPDHHNYSIADIQKIDQGFDEIKTLHKIILTTEKDYMRLKDESALIENLFYLPIEVELNDYESFKEILLDYVRKN
ncbi:MAG: tetraacyldisaccharide 4'-kinase [Weeksellaceae bacterium]|nr:tetraacyldisaccharide 4'-kinase [Weeksellaceae bacterium]